MLLAEFSHPGLLQELSPPGEEKEKEKEKGEKKPDYPNQSTRQGVVIDELAKEYEGRVVILRVPMVSCSETVKKYNVSKAPTFTIFKNGEEVLRDDYMKLITWFRDKLDKLLTPAPLT